MRPSATPGALFLLLCTAGCQDEKNQSVKYIFHFHLSEEETATLPGNVGTLVRLIESRKLEASTNNEREKLFLECPYRKKGQKRERLLWRLDGQSPEEGDKCVLVDIWSDGQVDACGLVIIDS